VCRDSTMSCFVWQGYPRQRDNGPSVPVNFPRCLYIVTHMS
jgi:hypothetical protein